MVIQPPVQLLYSLGNAINPTESNPVEVKFEDIDWSEEGVSHMVSTKSRKGLITIKDGKYYFREGKRGKPKKIGKFKTDGYDYVYEYYGRLYVTHNLAEDVISTYRFDLPPTQELVLSEIKGKYLAYLDTLV